MLGETHQNSSDNKQWFSSNHIHKKRRLVPPFKSLGRGGFVLDFVVSRTSDLLLCVVANLRPHILKFARLRSTPLLHKIRRTTICGSHPIPFVKKRRLTPPFKSLGRGGFEPPYSRENRFTVCRLQPLGHLPIFSCHFSRKVFINLPLTRFELVTSPLPRECSTPEPQGPAPRVQFRKSYANYAACTLS